MSKICWQFTIKDYELVRVQITNHCYIALCNTINVPGVLGVLLLLLDPSILRLMTIDFGDNYKIKSTTVHRNY